MKAKLLALTLLLLGLGLGSYGLLEDNEARFFEISWEMAQSHDWVTPHLNFIEHFHKPPGTFWLVASSLRLFGPSEWAGRLPVALAGLLTIGLTFHWMTRTGGQRLAVRAVLVLLTSVEFWFLSRLVLTDMFLTLTVTSAFYWAWRARSSAPTQAANPQTSPRASTAWLPFWLSLAAGFLVKGPIGLAIVMPVLFLHHLTSPQQKWNLRPTLGLPLFLLLALPWYVLVCLQNDGLLAYFLRFQTAQRMLTTVHGRPGPWWFYLPVLLAGFFPWSTGLAYSLREAWYRRDDLDRLLLLWVVVPLLFFSCAGSKLPTYLLPIFPALAMLTARASGQSPEARRLSSIALGTQAALGLALALYLAHGAAAELQPATGQLQALATLLILSPALAFHHRRGASDDAWFAWPALTFAGGLLLLAGALGPCDRAYSARELARTVIAQQPQPGDLVEIADHLHGLPYYLDQRLVQVAFPRETQFEENTDYQRYLYPDLASYLASRKPSPTTLIVMRRSDYETYANRSWTHWNIGPWILLRPFSQAAPDLPLSRPQPDTRPLGGGPGLQ